MNKYTIIDELGGGAFGTVFLCENNNCNKRREAVKVIDMKNNNGHVHPGFESSVLEYLRGSEYIVNIYDATQHDNDYEIQMEYCGGGSLQNKLNNEGFVDIGEVIKITRSVILGLEYAHIRNILHLDIKPGNILIGNDGKYKIGDFGLSNIIENGLSQFKLIYTIHYPPERIKNKTSSATEQSDIYMLGVMLYRLVNGDSNIKSLYEGNKDNIASFITQGLFPPRDVYLPHVPNKIKKIINKCMNIDLDKRYKTITEIKKDLLKLPNNYSWKKTIIEKEKQIWEGYDKNNTKVYELDVFKNGNNWDIFLYKYTKKSKQKIKAYCKKQINDKDKDEHIKLIFDYFF